MSCTLPGHPGSKALYIVLDVPDTHHCSRTSGITKIFHQMICVDIEYDSYNDNMMGKLKIDKLKIVMSRT